MTHLYLVTSNHDLSQDKAVAGVGNNKPIHRKQLIYQQLLQHSSQVTLRLSNVTDNNGPSSSVSGLDLALCVHSSDYLSFLSRAWKEWSDFVASGKADLYMTLEGTRSTTNTSFFVPGQIAPRDPHRGIAAEQEQQQETKNDGHRGTTPAEQHHLSMTSVCLSRPGNTIHSQICYYALDRMTPIMCNTLNDLQHDLQTIQTALTILYTHSNTSPTQPPAFNVAPVVYALTTHPGHHASVATYGGYCYINNAAVAAALLSQTHKRVGLLDIDYHHGNGSMHIFYHNDSVYFASLHCHPDFDYPYNTGYADQTGAGRGSGYTINVPLPQHTAWATYKQDLAQILQQFHQAGVSALVVSLGVDTVLKDPECSPLGGFDLVAPDYREMGQMIRALNLPCLYVQEGGYKLDEVPILVRNLLLPDAQ